MKRNIGIPDATHLAIGDTLGGDLAQTVAHDGQGGMGGKITAHPPPRMVRMSVGDQCAVHPPPRVDIEITRSAIDAIFRKAKNRYRCHVLKIGATGGLDSAA